MNTYQNILIHDENKVRWIGLNRQEAKNALNFGLLTDLVQACREADDDPEVGVIVVYSCVTNVFSAGADLKERRGMNDRDVKRRRVFARDCYEHLEKIEKPLLAAVEGKVIGGGGEIIGCCDIILGSENSSYRYVEVVVGSVGATQRITRLVGRQKAKELLFTGREIGAHEAYEIGLIARVLPEENFLVRVQEIASLIASRSPVSLAVTKKAVNMADEAAPEHGILLEQLGIELNIAKGSWKEGLEDFKTRK